MLEGVRVYSGDAVWRHVFQDLGATVVDAPNVLDISIDDLNIKAPISAQELRVFLLHVAEYTDTINNIFGKDVPILSHLQRLIIVALYRSGGMSVAQLRDVVGYAPGVTTNNIEMAISQIRKVVGHDFIKNNNGIYVIGKL